LLARVVRRQIKYSRLSFKKEFYSHEAKKLEKLFEERFQKIFLEKVLMQIANKQK
jgi:hypothetical protein